MQQQDVLLSEVERHGYKGAFVSLDHLASMKADIDKPLNEGKIPPKIADYYLQYDFSIPEDYQSLFVVSCKIPNSKVLVDTSHGIKDMILPTVYYPTSEAATFDSDMEHLFSTHSVRYKKVHLPLKLLACRSGLSYYGRNNISYVEDFGSYHKLTAYFIDLKIDPTPWHPLSFHPLCTDCHICEANCPSGIIHHEDYLIDTSKCLPLPNEIEGDFPDWVKPSHHNALMGCLRCQSVCPINPPLEKTTQHVTHLSEADVLNLFQIDSYECLDQGTKEKVKALSFSDYYPVFRRNFIALYKTF